MDVAFALFFSFAVMAGFTVGTGYLAERKGRCFAAWAAVGFFLGIFGPLLAAALPSKKPAY